MRILLSRPLLTAALIAACLHASPCAAQQRAYAWEAPPAEDAQWEQRRESYRGGPIRPGGELERSANPLFGAGITVFALSFAFSFAGLAEDRGYAIIPLVGPWLAATDALGGAPSNDLAPFMVIDGIAQAAGLVMLVIGALTPEEHVIYDAPVGAPPRYDQARLHLRFGAPGAELGASLVLEAL